MSLSNSSIGADAPVAAFGKTAFADFASARYKSRKKSHEADPKDLSHGFFDGRLTGSGEQNGGGAAMKYYSTTVRKYPAGGSSSVKAFPPILQD